MINIRVDEAYAFDYLSILEVKARMLGDRKSAQECYDYIKSQLDEDTFKEVIGSVQYKDLIKANKKVFDLVEAIRKGEKLDAKAIDDANMTRFMYKKELQGMFFGKDLIEKKTAF